MQRLVSPLPKGGKTHVHLPSIHSVLLQFTPLLKHPGYWNGEVPEGYANDGLNNSFFYFVLHVRIKMESNIATGA